MHVALAIQVAVAFCWTGMVLAISFLEAPLKFRAPGITIELGVGIGRLVFRALNAVEAVLALAVLVTCVVPWPGASWSAVEWWRLILAVAAAVVLAVQAGELRRRMDARVLDGRLSDGQPRHRLHIGYIALEGVKLIVLLALGVIGLAALGAPV
jgi:hypothetical protein